MGTIVSNGVVFTGSTNKPAANEISYMNVTSGLSSKNAQDAIDELAATSGNLLTDVSKLYDYNKPRCVLVDNKGTISSDYGFTYTSLSEMIQNDTWQGVIKNGDYIRLTTLNDEVFNLVFNINTYKNYGDDGHIVGKHIDLISEHLIPSSGGWQMRTENTNNGTADEKSPYLASTNMITKLQTYFDNNIPTELKGHIVTKRVLAPTRYSADGTLTDDTGWEWKDLGKMWLPYENEIAGTSVWGTKVYQGGLRQYPCFQDGTQICKKLGENGGRYDWWTASAYSGYSTNFVDVTDNGRIGDNGASGAWLAVPLCMRFK